MLGTCRDHSFLINWIESASRWFHSTDYVFSSRVFLINIITLLISFIQLYKIYAGFSEDNGG
jgi:hypothetical protein